MEHRNQDGFMLIRKKMEPRNRYGIAKQIRFDEKGDKLLRLARKYYQIPISEACRIAVRKFWKPIIIKRVKQEREMIEKSRQEDSIEPTN